MALSRVRYEQTVSGNRSFAVPFPYLSRDHVEVKVSGVVAAFAWVDNQNILMDVAPAVGAVVSVKRVTPTDVLVDFTDGSTLTERELDLGYLQNLYLAQESLDDAEDSMKIGDDGHWDARNRRIRNVADPVDNQDAATKAYVENRLQSINDLVSQLEQAVDDAEAAANSATSAAAVATAQAALAQAQVALAQAAASAAASDAAQAALDAAAATSAAAAAAQAVSDATDAVAAAQAAQAAAEAAAADAGTAGAAAGATAGAAAADQAIQDAIDSGELGGSYPGTTDEETTTKDLRRAWAAISSEEQAISPFTPTDMTSADHKAVLHPGISQAIGKRMLYCLTPSPSKIRWNVDRWQYSIHSNPTESWNDLLNDDNGRPSLYDSNSRAIIVGALPGEYFADPGTFGVEVNVPGFRMSNYCLLRSTPIRDGSGGGAQNLTEFQDIYDAMVLGDNTIAETKYDCYQEVIIKFINSDDTSDTRFFKYARHVSNFQNQYYGGNWKLINNTSKGAAGSFGDLETTSGVLKVRIPGKPNYYLVSATGNPLVDSYLRIKTQDGVLDHAAFGENGSTNRMSFVGLRENGIGNDICNKGLSVSGESATSIGTVSLDTNYATGSSTNRFTLSKLTSSANFEIRNSYTNDYGSTISGYSSGTQGESRLVMKMNPVNSTNTMFAASYAAVGAFRTDTQNFLPSEPTSYSKYKSSGGAAGPTKQIHLTRSDTGSLTGMISGTNNNILSTGDITNGSISYSMLFMQGIDKSSAANGTVGFYRNSSLSVFGGRSELRSYAARYRYEAISALYNAGSYELYLGNSVSPTDFTTSGAFSNGLQGTGLSIFNAESSGTSIGIRISSRWSSGNAAVGVISSDHAGTPGEVAGVAPMRFTQDLTTGSSKVWLAPNAVIGTDTQNTTTINDANSTVVSVTRIGLNRKIVVVRQRTLVPNASGVITYTLPESYRNLISVSYTRDQSATGIAVTAIPDTFSMASATSRSSVAVMFQVASLASIVPATTALQCAGLITFIVEE